MNNLSYYLIFLISYIVQYFSDSYNLKINKIELNIKDIVDFTFKVLKTLLESNENKMNKFKTILDVDSMVARPV